MSTEQIEAQSQPEATEQVTDQAVETVSPDNSETATEVEGSEGNGDQVQQQRKHGAEKRIGKLVGKIGHLGRENEQLKAELEEMRNKINALTPPDTKPDISDPKWKTIDEYNDALINWHQRQQNKPQVSQPVQQPEKSSPRGSDNHVETWAKQFAEYAKEDPEISALKREDVAWFMEDLPQIGEIIDRSYNPALVKHFAQNPELVYDLEGLDKIDLAIEIGKIAATLTRKTPVKKTTNNGAPITPVKGNGARPIKPDRSLSGDEYFRKHFG